MSTQKILNPLGSITLTDLTNNYEMELEFDAEKNKRSTGISAFFSMPPSMTETGGLQFRKDLISIQIFKLETSGEGEEETTTRGLVVAKGEGSYLEHIKYESDDEAIWSINSDISRMKWVEELSSQLVLPSDSSRRIDAHHILS